jgi:type I restriction enzyme, S subunit
MIKWHDRKLSDLTTYIGRGITPKYTEEKSLSVVNQRCIRKGRVNLDIARRHDESIKKPSSVKYLNNLDTLVNSTGVGTLGRVGLFRGEGRATVDTHVTIVRKNELIDPKYLFYNLFSRQKEIERMAEGSTGQTELSRHRLGDMVLKVPPLQEQKAIAEALSSLDDKIELLQKQNETLEALAQTLFRQWFIEEADDSWEEVELHELVDLQGGYAFKSSSYVDHGDYTVITIKSVQDGYLDTQSANHIDLLPEKLKPHQLLEHGDVLLSLTGNVGRVCFVDKENCVLNQRVAKIQAKNEAYRSWSYLFFRQPHMISQLTALSKGTAQLNLSPVETAKIVVKNPDNRVLEKFNTVVSPMLQKILLNKLSIHSISDTRDTILPKLMSGQVRVKLD